MSSSACSVPGVGRATHRRGREFLQFHNDLFLLWDCCAGFLIGYLTDVAYMRLAWRSGGLGGVPAPSLLHEMVLCSVVAALILRERQLVTVQYLLDGGRVFGALARRGLCAVAILMLVGWATRALNDFARLWVTGWWVGFAGWVVASRLVFVAWGRRIAATGALRETVAVVGAGGSARDLALRLERDACVVAVLDHTEGAGAASQPELMRLIAELVELARRGEIDTIIISEIANVLLFRSLLVTLNPLPIQVAVASEMVRFAGDAVDCRMIGSVPLAIILDRPRRAWEYLVKLLLDRVLAVLFLATLAPLMAAIALAVLWESPGPVIFRQQRSGCGGRPFTIYKFRSMRLSDGTARRQTAIGDTRITRVGRILRELSLDELPQFWNVLIGDMSLVGPRPHDDALHLNEQEEPSGNAGYPRRQCVKPGLTGWAQVSGWRGPANTAEQLAKRVECDLYYIENWSLFLDLRILAMTPLAVISRRNAR